MLSKEALLSFPDFTKQFHLYSDASDKQLGATVVQEGKPLGFYARKLNPAQKNYTVGERELLGIVEGLKAFEGILRGQDVVVHTDHLNLLYQAMPTQRMVRWRLLLEEFHPIVKHVAGKDNDAADALSRLDMSDNDGFDEIEWGETTKPLTYADEVKERIQMLFPMASEENLQDKSFPLAPDMFKAYQENDRELQRLMDSAERRNSERFTTRAVEGVELIHDGNQ